MGDYADPVSDDDDNTSTPQSPVYVWGELEDAPSVHDDD